MMMKYELKKFFHKKINKIILIVMVFLASIISCLAVGSMRYRDAEGKLYTGITAGRRLAADRNKWKGKLTVEKIKEVVKNMGFEASLGVEEKINIIKKEDERCLFGLYRYNRSGIISTEEFMKKVFGA